MILVDASVWIDYFRGEINPHTEHLDRLLNQGQELVGVADLVVFEVLRGFRANRALQEAQRLLMTLPQVEIGGMDHVLEALHHDRALRAKGYTIRSPIDVLQASYCITHGHLLLHKDADFQAFHTLRGLQTWPL
jgi:predicted nucleic acid-binding protein